MTVAGDGCRPSAVPGEASGRCRRGRRSQRRGVGTSPSGACSQGFRRVGSAGKHSRLQRLRGPASLEMAPAVSLLGGLWSGRPFSASSCGDWDVRSLLEALTTRVRVACRAAAPPACIGRSRAGLERRAASPCARGPAAAAAGARRCAGASSPGYWSQIVLEPSASTSAVPTFHVSSGQLIAVCSVKSSM